MQINLTINCKPTPEASLLAELFDDLNEVLRTFTTDVIDDSNDKGWEFKVQYPTDVALRG